MVGPEIESGKLWVETAFRELLPDEERSAWAFKWEDPLRHRAEDFSDGYLGFAVYRGEERKVVRFLEKELEGVKKDPRIQNALRRRLEVTQDVEK